MHSGDAEESDSSRTSLSSPVRKSLWLRFLGKEGMEEQEDVDRDSGISRGDSTNAGILPGPLYEEAEGDSSEGNSVLLDVEKDWDVSMVDPAIIDILNPKVCDPYGVWESLPKMIDYGERVATFSVNYWMKFFRNVPQLTPEKMASAGWFCSGERAAQCFACFKDLEEWESKDDPFAVHRKHCPDCPLTKMQNTPFSRRKWKDFLKIRVGVAFRRRRTTFKAEHAIVLQHADKILQYIDDRIAQLE